MNPISKLSSIDPRRASVTWYEMFPRSQTTDPNKPATFRDAERRLPAISDMGFDVVYLPPIHPIGKTNHKGPNNSLNGAENAPGSPWAIGNEAGGHDAIDPGLGTVEDFQHFIATAANLGIEIAIDFALQCSPDHPWVREHPEWFRHRPDGTHQVRGESAQEIPGHLSARFRYQESAGSDGRNCSNRRVLDRARRAESFRVDNPHTKPLASGNG